MLTITVRALSQLAGGASAPEGLGELVPRHRSSLLGYEVREEEPTLPPGEARLVDHRAVGLDCDPTREENLQWQAPGISAEILPHLGVLY